MAERGPMTDENMPANDQDVETPSPESDELTQLQTEVAQLKDQAMRYAAEVENMRRRAEREVNDSRAYAIQKFARDLLGVADNLSRALAHAPKGDDDPLARNLAIGLEMTQKELLSAFDRNGLKRIAPAAGEKFDPHQHQAMTEQASETVPAGAVIEVMQDGYALFGRIVRPAMVVVAARGSKSGAPDEQPTASAQS